MADQWNDEQLAYLVRFKHVEKILSGMPGLNDQTVAALFGISGADYRAIRDAQNDAARTAAAELMFEPGIEAAIEALPLRDDDTVVCLGDSITDDTSSWAEILRHLLAAARPAVRIVNAGISGDTTSQMITRFGEVVAARPAWILCLAGTNDARLHGLHPSKCLVSLLETEANLRMLANYAATQLDAVRWLYLTPPPVIEHMIGSHWFLGSLQMMWRNENLRQIAAVVRREFAPFVDLDEVFGCPPSPRLLLDDGLHPSLAGQQAMAKAVLTRWASLA